MRRLDGEKRDRCRCRGAEEQDRGIARGKRHVGEDDAGKRGVTDGVANEALPFVDAQGSHRRGHRRKESRAEGDDLERVISENIHVIAP